MVSSESEGWRESAEAAAFARIVRSSQDAVIAKTGDGVVTAWNGGATALYGWSAEQMLGTSVEVTVPPEAIAEERVRHARVASGVSESGYRCTRLRADGGRVDVVMSMSPVRDDAGAIVGLASISRRVSEAEEIDTRFAALLEAAPDAMVYAGPDGRIVTVNAQVSALFGYTRAELVGADLEMLLPQGLRERHIEHRRAYALEPRTRLMGSGLALLGRRRDGTEFPIEVSLAPEPRRDGMVIAAVRDVSERRALEASSLESESRLRQLAENVDILFVLLQLDPPAYLYVSPNAERILGRPIGEDLLVVDPRLHAIHADDRETFRRAFSVPSRAGLAATVECRVVGPNGTVRWLKTVATPVPSPDGPARRSVLTAIDTTDQVLAAEALRTAEAVARTANDTKNEFLSRMSHELRTPLNAILGFGQLLQRHLAGTDQSEAVGHILKGGRRLLDLINDVLDIARIESGQLSLSLEAVEVATVVDDVAQLMAPLASDAHLHMIVVGGPAETFVRSDRQRLRQILLNLTSNAIKYNEPAGNVWLSWKDGDGTVTISVRDDGLGISEELQHRLFTAFDRLGAEGSTVDGTGIGLFLTRSLAEAMGGTVVVESVLGQGSTFSVTLPAETPVGPDTTPFQISRTTSPNRLPKKLATVLYIEDNVPNVRMIEQVVRLRPEWRLIHAALGRLGVELARAHRPELVLLDLHLPDLSGREVLLALKGHPNTADTPVVILTADGNSEMPHQLRDAGADDFLTKPLDIDDILALLDDAIRRGTGEDPDG